MAVLEMVIDPVHSTLEFAATYAMNTVVKGRLRDFSGVITLDTAAPENSSVAVRMRAASVDSGDPTRDGQLRGADFLDVETHAEITFTSTDVETVERNRWQVIGDLRIGDISRSVALATRYYGIVEDATGITRAGFVAETDIRRSDWGMTWNQEQPTGVLVSDRIRIALYISAIPADVADES